MAEDAGNGTTPASRYTITTTVIFLLLLPGIAVASTPPVQPSLVLNISSPDVHSDTPLTVSVFWNGLGIAFHEPPESIIVDVFSLPEGKQVATFSIPRAGITCSPDETCTYQRTIPAPDLPSGDLMLIATDPLSAAFDRQVITVNGHGTGSLGFRAGIGQERVFLGISFGLAVLLTGILVYLIRDRT
jgi:hypothetical protein